MKNKMLCLRLNVHIGCLNPADPILKLSGWELMAELEERSDEIRIDGIIASNEEDCDCESDWSPNADAIIEEVNKIK